MAHRPVCSVAALGLAACCTLFAPLATANQLQSKSSPASGTAIAQRLERAGYSIRPLPLGQFVAPRPIQAFSLVVDFTSVHSFVLDVEVYPNHAVAAAAVAVDVQFIKRYHVQKNSTVAIEGPVVFRRGADEMYRTIKPTTILPKRFRAIVALAEGR